jgi:hypothetical protein
MAAEEDTDSPALPGKTGTEEQVNLLGAQKPVFLKQS